MIVKNHVQTVAPVIPDELRKKLIIAATYQLTEHEAKLFSLALQAVVQQIKKEGIDFNKIPRTNAIITKDGSVEFQLESNVLGSHVSLAIYAVQKWRDMRYGDHQILMILIEELCHNYWNIEDETLVMYKVHQVIKWIMPNVELKDLYNV